MTHYHSWRRFSVDVFLCHHPTCFTRWKLETIDGKVAKCPQCNKDFIVSAKLIAPDAMFITCENCKPDGAYSPATIQEIQARLDVVAKATYKEIYTEKLRDLEVRDSR